MAIFLTEELPKVFACTPGRTLAYFLCDSSFDTRKTASSVFRGLIWQLVQQNEEHSSHLLRRYHERGQILFESFDALWSILMEIIAQETGHIFCIIDALDECEKKSKGTLLRQLLNLKFNNTASKLKLLITSRPYPEIKEHLEEFALSANLAAFPESQQDVNRFVDEKVASLQNRKKYTNGIVACVKQILQIKSEGTFLWVGLACDELDKILSKDAIRTLEKLAQGLHALYQSLLASATKENNENVIKRILSFVVVSQRPPTVLELSQACQLHVDEDLEIRIQFTRDDISSCRLMVIIQDNCVLLLHQSVQDLLVGSNSQRFLQKEQAHADAAYRCIDQIIGDSEEMHMISWFPDEWNFSRYAMTFWSDQARMARLSRHSRPKIVIPSFSK
jgi:hypothetical protein